MDHGSWHRAARTKHPSVGPLAFVGPPGTLTPHTLPRSSRPRAPSVGPSFPSSLAPETLLTLSAPAPSQRPRPHLQSRVQVLPCARDPQSQRLQVRGSALRWTRGCTGQPGAQHSGHWHCCLLTHTRGPPAPQSSSPGALLTPLDEHLRLRAKWGPFVAPSDCPRNNRNGEMGRRVSPGGDRA